MPKDLFGTLLLLVVTLAFGGLIGRWGIGLTGIFRGGATGLGAVTGLGLAATPCPTLL